MAPKSVERKRRGNEMSGNPCGWQQKKRRWEGRVWHPHRTKIGGLLCTATAAEVAGAFKSIDRIVRDAKVQLCGL